MPRRWNQWLLAPVESVFLQVPRALAVSVLAALLDCGILALLRLTGMPAVPAAIVGYLAGGVLQYVLCSVWVFSSANAPSNSAVGFVAFTVLSLGGLVITAGVVALVHDWADLPVALAKFLALGLAFAWNFLSRKYLLFRPVTRRVETDAPAGVSA